MTAKLKIREIVNPDFAWAMSNILNASVPAKAGYWLSKAFRKVESNQKHYDEARIKALKKYCDVEKAPDGSEVIVSDPKTKEAIFRDNEGKAKFQKELDELLDQEVEIPTLKFELLGEDTKVETRLLVLLDKIIVMSDQGGNA